MPRNASTNYPLDHKVLMLEQLFRDYLPVNNATLRGGRQVGNLSDECLQYIVLRSWQNWKPSQIADVLGISSHSVRSSLRLFKRDSTRFRESKIVVAIASPDKRRSTRYLCRFHGEQFMRVGPAVTHCWVEMFRLDSV